MRRLWSKNATGIAPDGRWYAGDVNALQDAVAAQSDFTQAIDLATVRIGDSTIQFLKYGTSEARLTAALRIDGVLRALGGLYAGAFTTVDRDAIPAGSRPYGLVILNTTANQLQCNFGTDAAPVWKPVGVDPAGSLVFYPQAVNNIFMSTQRNGENFPRTKFREDGRYSVGPGTADVDTYIERTAPGVFSINGLPIITGSIGTTLPATPVNGQEFTLVDSLTAPTYSWNLKYMAGIAGAAKWVYIGGPAKYQEIAAQVTSSAASQYVDLGGPAITVPNSGTYTAELSCVGSPNSSSGVAYVRAALVVNNTLPALFITRADDVEWQRGTSVFRTCEIVLSANDIVDMWYYSNSAGFTTAYQERRLALTPRIIG